MTADRAPARILFPTERARCLWAQVHEARLMTWSRPDLHAAWDAACLGMKTEGRRARKVELARDLAHADADLLGKEWPALLLADCYLGRDLDTAEARVRKAGTPVRWATEDQGDRDACPFDEHGNHGSKVNEPTCVRCGQDLSAAVAGWRASEEGQAWARIAEGMRAAQAARNVASV